MFLWNFSGKTSHIEGCLASHSPKRCRRWRIKHNQILIWCSWLILGTIDSLLNWDYSKSISWSFVTDLIWNRSHPPIKCTLKCYPLILKNTYDSHPRILLCNCLKALTEYFHFVSQSTLNIYYSTTEILTLTAKSSISSTLPYQHTISCEESQIF